MAIKSMQKLNPLNVPFCVLLDISFQKYIKIIKSKCERWKTKSRKYCKQRRSILELQIHLRLLIVLSVENISLLCFWLVWLYVSLIRTKRWQLPKKKAIPCFIHMVEIVVKFNKRSVFDDWEPWCIQRSCNTMKHHMAKCYHFQPT